MVPVDLDQYYNSDPDTRDPDWQKAALRRYPKNHVRFSSLLKPLEWLEPAAAWLGVRPLGIKDGLLREYDRAKPFSKPLGTPEEVARLRELLEFFCERVDKSPFISPIGRYLMKVWGSNLIKARTDVLRYCHEHRETIKARGKVRAPILITGTPRSGTTLLHRLLSEDPSTRSPYAYEMEAPIPPRSQGIDPLADPRIEKSGNGLKLMSRLAPGFLEKFAESHYLSPTEMEECFVYMLVHNGVNMMCAPQAGRDYFVRTLEAYDKRPVFRYERLFLTMLDAACPVRSHWTLKAPHYAPFFPLLFEEYPDARVILTHRNPLITLPSMCRLMESWCIAFDRNGTFDKHRFGQLVEPLISRCLAEPLAYRKAHPEREAQIFDCMYDELFNDPMGMVKRVYEKFDLELTPVAEKRMIVYLENNRQGKYGRHQYSLEEYGFVAQDVYENYRSYVEHYGFAIPGPSERPQAIAF